MSHAWHPADIKAAIEKRGGTLAQIGRDAGIAASTPKAALYRRCYVGEQAIAKFLNLHPRTIWPDRYDSDGLPLHKRVRKRLSNVSEVTNKCKIAEEV